MGVRVLSKVSEQQDGFGGGVLAILLLDLALVKERKRVCVIFGRRFYFVA